jgi:hypothetical protein
MDRTSSAEPLGGLERDLIELVALAPTPLYSAYKYAVRDMAAPFTMADYFRLVDRLLAAGILELWQEDLDQPFEVVPSDLPERYAAAEHDDMTYDPFTFSLFITPKGEMLVDRWRS